MAVIELFFLVYSPSTSADIAVAKGFFKELSETMNLSHCKYLQRYYIIFAGVTFPNFLGVFLKFP